MADLFGIDYDVLSLDFNESESRHRALISEPLSVTPTAPLPPTASARPAIPITPTPTTGPAQGKPLATAASAPAASTEPAHVPAPEEAKNLLVQEHIVSQAPTTERLQSIQRMVADQLGDAVPPDFERNALQAIPVQAGGLYPISDVWYIDPGLDTPDRLRIHIGQFAQEIADEVALNQAITPCEDGIGFRCMPLPPNPSRTARAVWTLLASLSGHGAMPDTDQKQLAADLPVLLHGRGQPASRVSDTALVKLFRMLRLARRLLDLEPDTAKNGP